MPTYYYDGRRVSLNTLMQLKRQKKITEVEFKAITVPSDILATDTIKAEKRIKFNAEKAEKEKAKSDLQARQKAEREKRKKFKQYTLEEIKVKLPGISESDAIAAMNIINSEGPSGYTKWVIDWSRRNKSKPQPPKTREQLLAEGKKVFDEGGFSAYSAWAKKIADANKEVAIVEPATPLGLAQQFQDSLTTLSVGFKSAALQLYNANVFQDVGELNKYLADPDEYIRTYKPKPKPPPPTPTVEVGGVVVTTGGTSSTDPIRVNTGANVSEAEINRNNERVNAEGGEVPFFERTQVSAAEVEAEAIARFRSGGFPAYSEFAQELDKRIKAGTMKVNPSIQPTIWDSQIRRLSVNYEIQRDHGTTAPPPVITEQQVLTEGQRIFREKGYDAYVAWAQQYSKALHGDLFTIKRSEERSEALKGALGTGTGKIVRDGTDDYSKRDSYSTGDSKGFDTLNRAKAKIVRDDTTDYSKREPYSAESGNKELQEILKTKGAIIGKDKQLAPELVQWRLTPATKPTIPSSNISSFVLSNIRALSGNIPLKNLLLTMMLRRYTSDDMYNTATEPSLVDASDSRQGALTVAIKINRYSISDQYKGIRSDITDINEEFVHANENKYTGADQYKGKRSDITDIDENYVPTNTNKYTGADQYKGKRSDITDLNEEFETTNKNDYTDDVPYVADEESRLKDLGKEHLSTNKNDYTDDVPYVVKGDESNLTDINEVFESTNENVYTENAPYIAGEESKLKHVGKNYVPNNENEYSGNNPYIKSDEDNPSPVSRILSLSSLMAPTPTTAVASNSNSSEFTSTVEQPYDERKADDTGLVTRLTPSDVLQDIDNLLLPPTHPKADGRPVFDQLYTNNRRVTVDYPEGMMSGVPLRGVQEGSSPGEEGTLDKVFSYADDRKLIHGIDRGFTQNISAGSPKASPAVQQTDALQDVAGVIGAGNQQYFPFLFETDNRKTSTGGYKKQTCFLQATLNQIQESYAPNWTGKSFFGRTEKVYTYTETDRVLDIQFVIFADSIRQLQNVYERVNWLAQQTYGQYEAYGQAVNRLGAGPLVRLTIGDMLQRVPGYIRNLSLNWDHSGAGGKWEITESLKMPVSCQVSLSYQIIHPDMPDRDMNFYWGLAKGMGGGLIQTNRNKESNEDSYVRQIGSAVPVSDSEVDQYSTFYSNNEVPAVEGTQDLQELVLV